MGHEYGHRKKQKGKNTNGNLCDLLQMYTYENVNITFTPKMSEQV